MKFYKVDMDREYEYDEILNILVTNNNALYKEIKKAKFRARVSTIATVIVYGYLGKKLYEEHKLQKQMERDLQDDLDAEEILKRVTEDK